MRKRQNLWLALAAMLLLLTNLVAGETTPAPLPAHLSVHVSIKSVNGLIGALDAFVVAATDGTQYSLPPGLRWSMIVGELFHNPIPENAWKSDGELHLLFPAEEEAANAVAIIQADGFEHFLEALEDRGAEVQDDADTSTKLGGRAVEISLTSADEFMAFDFGEGRIGISLNAKALENILLAPEIGAWKAWPHLSDAEATVNISLAGIMGELDLENILNILTDAALIERELTEVLPMKVRPDLIQGIFAAGEKLLRVSAEEVKNIRTVSADLRLNDERLAAGLRFAPESGSLLDHLTSALGRLGSVENDLAWRVPTDPIVLSIGAPAEDIFPGFRERFVPFAADLAGMLFPDQKAALEKTLAAMLTNSDGGEVSASYFNADYNTYTVSWLNSSNPSALLASIDDGIRLANDMLASMAEAPGIGLTIKSEKGEAGGHAFIRYRFELAADSVLWNLIAGGDASEFARILEEIDNSSIYAGAVNATAILVAGQVNADDFASAAAIAAGAGKKDEALLEREAAKQVLGWLPNRQGALLIVDVDWIFPLIAVKLAEMPLGGLFGDDNPYIMALEKTLPDIEKHGEFIGAAWGAANGQPGIELALPAKALNSLILAFDVYMANLNALLADQDSEDEDDLED
ncbi:MAG: hypothetical protein FWG74_05510 [Planctomycetes bacterium]|nr:hypothetical protein [Planctomycetota bacterium]